MASAISMAVSTLLLPSSANRVSAFSSCKYTLQWKPLKLSPSPRKGRSGNQKPYRLVCRAAEYKFPDPIPEFADSETEKFRNHLLENLPMKKEIYGDSIEEIIGICTKILSEFLHTEYGGPGTLLVDPFCDMADIITERGLPGAPEAARTAVKWAQKHIDNDWKAWNSNGSS